MMGALVLPPISVGITEPSTTRKPVVFFRLDGDGHTMPSRQYCEGSGRQRRDIEGAEEILRALKNVRR